MMNSRTVVRHSPVFEVRWSDLRKGDRVEHFEYGAGTVYGSGPALIYIGWDSPKWAELTSHGSSIARYLQRIDGAVEIVM